MIRLFACLMFVFFSGVWCVAQPARLIVRGDDMGFTHSANVAIIESHEKGIETTIEVIVNSPWFPEAVALLSKHPRADVGVHLVLTSEWENLKWRPLTQAKSLTDSNGYLLPMIWPNKNYPGRALLERDWDIMEIEREWRAQIELAKKNIPGLTHISGHMGCTNMSDETKSLAASLAKEYDIDIDPNEYDVQQAPYEPAGRSAADKIKAFKTMLGKLVAGRTYLFVEHPGLDNEELRAVHHIGYEDVASDRQGVTDMWTDTGIKEMIKTKNITLISYADLRKNKQAKDNKSK